MRKTIVWAVCGLALTAGSLTAQPAAGLIDVFRVQVRPDKSMEYENLTKKLAEINRKKGDHWIAFSTEYGASNIIYFAARRSGYRRSLIRLRKPASRRPFLSPPCRQNCIRKT